MKKLILGGVTLAACLGMFAGGNQVRAAFIEDDETYLPGAINENEADYGTIEGEETGTVDAKGVFKKWDAGNPGGPGDPDPGVENQWIKVQLPKKILFGSTDVSKNVIFGPKYQLTNQSSKGVKITVNSFTWNDQETVNNGKYDMDLKLMSAGAGSEAQSITLLSAGNPTGGEINEELTTLAKQGDTYQFTLKGNLKAGFSFEDKTLETRYNLIFGFETVDDQPGDK